MKKIKYLMYLTVIFCLFSCNYPEKKEFKGIKIIFFCGGLKNDPVSSIIYNGARQAEKDFSCSVDYVYSNWDSNKIIDDFKDAIEIKPDGICVMGHPGDKDMLPLVEEAINKGIAVTTQNIDLPIIEDKYADKGFGYVGQNIYRSGYNLAKLCRDRINLTSRDKVVIWGGLPNPKSPRKSRTDGIKDFLAENNIMADLLEMRVEDRIEPLTKGYEHFLEYYKTNPDLKLILISGGVLTGYIAEIFIKAGIPPGKIKCAGYDLSEGSIKGIKEGYIDFVNDQQPFLQGYLPVLQVCLTKKYGFSGLHINTDSSFVDESNVLFFEKLAREKIR